MKKRFLTDFLFSLLAICMFAACNDPVFYAISQEVEPIDPRINGAASNFAFYKNAMYVASGSRLYRYSEKKWEREKSPGEKILQIASTDNYLYALCYEDSNTRTRTSLKRFNGTWNTFGGYDTIQYIFSANNKVFIGDESSSSILCIDETDSTGAIKTLGLQGEISGAAYDGTNYYLCTRDKGIYRLTASLVKEEFNDNSGNYAGIIEIKNGKIAVITRNGSLHIITGNGLSSSIASFEFYATGALALYEHSTGSTLLLAGRQDRLVYTADSGYTYGYLELELDQSQPNGIKSGGSFREPGQITVSSVTDGDNERYRSTIGKYPVNHIIQAPDGILFASTQKNGVWSYRKRSSGLQWNAEE